MKVKVAGDGVSREGPSEFPFYGAVGQEGALQKPVPEEPKCRPSANFRW